MDLREFYNLPNGSNITLEYIEDTNLKILPLPTNMNYYFYFKQNKVIDSTLDFTNVTNMSYMLDNSHLVFLIKPNWDTSKVTDMSYMFENTHYVKVIDLSTFNTSNVTNIRNIFDNTYITNISSLSNWDTSKVADMQYIFYNSKISDFSPIQNWDVSNVTTLYYAFYNSYLKKLDLSNWNTSKVTDMRYIVNISYIEEVSDIDCTKVEKDKYPIYGYSNSTTLTKVGQFKNMRASWVNNYGLAKCPNLTRESYINIFNGMYDFVGNGVTPTSNEGKIKLHSNYLTVCTEDDIALAIGKGWTIST